LLATVSFGGIYIGYHFIFVLLLAGCWDGLYKLLSCAFVGT